MSSIQPNYCNAPLASLWCTEELQERKTPEYDTENTNRFNNMWSNEMIQFKKENFFWLSEQKINLKFETTITSDINVAVWKNAIEFVSKRKCSGSNFLLDYLVEMGFQLPEGGLQYSILVDSEGAVEWFKSQTVGIVEFFLIEFAIVKKNFKALKVILSEVEFTPYLIFLIISKSVNNLTFEEMNVHIFGNIIDRCSEAVYYALDTKNINVAVGMILNDYPLSLSCYYPCVRDENLVLMGDMLKRKNIPDHEILRYAFNQKKEKALKWLLSAGCSVPFEMLKDRTVEEIFSLITSKNQSKSEMTISGFADHLYQFEIMELMALSILGFTFPENCHEIAVRQNNTNAAHVFSFLGYENKTYQKDDAFVQQLLEERFIPKNDISYDVEFICQ